MTWPVGSSSSSLVVVSESTCTRLVAGFPFFPTVGPAPRSSEGGDQILNPFAPFVIAAQLRHTDDMLHVVAEAISGVCVENGDDAAIV